MKTNKSFFEQEETDVTEFFQFSVFSACSCSKFLRPALHGEKGGHAGNGAKAGPVLGRDWPATPADGVTRSEVGSKRSDFPISQFHLLSISAFQLLALRANCGRKILRPSCFATSSSGLNACRKWLTVRGYQIHKFPDVHRSERTQSRLAGDDQAVPARQA